MQVFEQTDRENSLMSAFNRHGNGGSLDLASFEACLQSLGQVDPAKISEWKNHYQSKGMTRLSANDLRSVIGLPTRTETVFSQRPRETVILEAPRVKEEIIMAPRQYAPVQERIVEYKAAPVQERIVEYKAAPVIQQRIIDAPIIKKSENYAPRQYAPILQEKIIEYKSAPVFIDTIGPPPVVEDWLLVPVQAVGGFGDQFAQAAGILREIEDLEIQQEQRIRNVLNGFQGAGGFSPKLDILTRLTDYCKALRAELNACANHDYGLQQQYDQLVAYLKQFQAWEIYVKGLKNYYNELQQALNEINVFKMKVQQLMEENKQLNIQCSIYMNQISVLEQQKRVLEEKVRVIPFLQKIILDQAFEIIQLKADITGQMQDLNGLHGHYQGLFAQIASVGNNQGAFTKQARLIVRGLKEACVQVIESALSASKDSLTGQDALDKSQARAVAQCILELDTDVHKLSLDNIESYIGTGEFDAQWMKYAPSGRLVGRANIMSFFNHVVERKTQAGVRYTEDIFVQRAPTERVEVIQI